MEGDKQYHAKLAKNVKSLQKFFDGDRIKVKGTKMVGTVVAISSQTHFNYTILIYEIKLDDMSFTNQKTLYYDEGELTRVDDRPEKVVFS
jgi:hypothetical protein